MEIAKLVLEYLRVLIWPGTVFIISLIFRRQIVLLFSRIRRAELPGGLVFDLEQDLKEMHALSVKVQEQPSPFERNQEHPVIPLTEANARMINLQLLPSPSGLDMSYYRNLARQVPNVALAGLRIEIEILARNIAKGFNVQMRGNEPVVMLIRKLYDAGAITTEQMQLTMKILAVCNAAVHGLSLSEKDANDVINYAEVLATQYLSWLSWGFADGWKPSQ